jgi:acyl-coenzyme A synthetase/AMP-(fatty) acid ligase
VSALATAIARAAAESADRAAVCWEERELLYGDLPAAASGAAREIRAEPGARVAAVEPDPLRLTALLLAAARAPWTLLLIDRRIPPAERVDLAAQFGAGVLLDGGSRLEPPAVTPELEAARVPGLALVTSGTTGKSKVIQRTWDTLSANTASFGRELGLQAGDPVLITTPLHHTYGLCAGLIGALLRGATSVVPPPPASPHAVATAVERHGARAMLSVPTLYRWYLESNIDAVPEIAVSAGERLDPALRERWRAAYRTPLIDHFGTTELGMVTVGHPGAAGSGPALPGIGLRAGEPGAPAPLHVRPTGEPPVALALGEAGGRADAELGPWVASGDVAVVDAGGNLVLGGRIGASANIGGVLVSFAEVADAIRAHPAIEDCAVLALEAEDGATRLAAVVQPRNGDEIAAAGVRAWAAQALAGAKVPSIVRVVSELPRTATGKVKLTGLRALL